MEHSNLFSVKCDAGGKISSKLVSTTPAVRRVNYYFAKPKERAPINVISNSKQQQPQESSFDDSFEQTKLMYNKRNTTSPTIAEFKKRRIVETFDNPVLNTDCNGTLAPIQAIVQEFCAKKAAFLHKRDPGSYQKTTGTAEKTITLKQRPVQKCFFEPKITMSDIIAAIESKTPLMRDDPFLFSEPADWLRNSTLTKMSPKRNFLVISSHFLQLECHNQVQKPLKPLSLDFPDPNIALLTLIDNGYDMKRMSDLLFPLSPRKLTIKTTKEVENCAVTDVSKHGFDIKALENVNEELEEGEIL